MNECAGSWPGSRSPRGCRSRRTTCRPPSPARPDHGRLPPAAAAVFAESATALGFVAKSSERQWAALAQVCALHAVAPDAVTHTLLDADATPRSTAAADRLGVAPHPNRHGDLVRAAGHPVPRRAQRRTTPPAHPAAAGPRADSWEQVPAVLAETLTGYLDQLRVTRRPGTVANEDEALREFACFLARRHPTSVRRPRWAAATSRTTSAGSSSGPPTTAVDCTATPCVAG